MKVTKKTVPALKISASWTPVGDVAARMMAAAMEGTAAPGVRFMSGRIGVAAAIEADFADPSIAARVATRASEIRKALEARGTVHDFRTSAGREFRHKTEALPPVAVSAQKGAA
jgi:hypothetical protein